MERLVKLKFQSSKLKGRLKFKTSMRGVTVGWLF